MEKIINKGKNIIEICIIFCIMFIGLRKGGYYKLDSLGIMYFLDLFMLIYLLLLEKIRISKRIVIPFTALVSAYFLNIVFGNFATLSGAINIATRIYSMYLVYITVVNSKHKEWYLKAILVFACICTILLLDEMSLRIFSDSLAVIDATYISETANAPETVFQYSNILGIICLLGIVYLYKKITEDVDYAINRIISYGLLTFLTVGIVLTHSKMVLLLYIVLSIYLPIRLNRKSDILWLITNLVISFLVSATKVFVIIIIVPIVMIYEYIMLKVIKEQKVRNIVNVIVLVVSIILVAFMFGLIKNTSMYLNFENYFSNYESTTLRFTYYLDGIKLATTSVLNFFVGMGGNAFRTMYETVQNTFYISLETHSILVQILVESGIIGLISFIAIIYNAFKESKNIIYKFMLFVIVLFASFDVFLTYTIMLYILAIILALNTNMAKVQNVDKKINIFNGIMYFSVFVILTIQVIAMFIVPGVVDNLNEDIQKQEALVSRCKTALMLDFCDLSYMEKYTKSMQNYLDIMDIKKDLYGQDDIEKRMDISNKIYKNIVLEKSFEKSNKYVYEDNIFGIYNNIDMLVQANYLGEEEKGYINYLEEIINNVKVLKEEHPLNDYASVIVKETIEHVSQKYEDINTMLNNSQITIMLDNLKEIAI